MGTALVFIKLLMGDQLNMGVPLVNSVKKFLASTSKLFLI